MNILERAIEGVLFDSLKEVLVAVEGQGRAEKAQFQRMRSRPKKCKETQNYAKRHRES
jgi:Holliday junction resolvasome RuvABC endonuclease subunit